MLVAVEGNLLFSEPRHDIAKLDIMTSSYLLPSDVPMISMPFFCLGSKFMSACHASCDVYVNLG